MEKREKRKVELMCMSQVAGKGTEEKDRLTMWATAI